MLQRSLTFLLAAAVAASPAFPYADVAGNAWYKTALVALLEKNVLDAAQKRFRPEASATRAEFLKLALALSGKTPGSPPLLPSFDDAAPTDWYDAVIEEAAKQGWMRGDGNCYGNHPCRARPQDGISRAETAVLLTRAFGFEKTDKAPPFIDADMHAWYGYGLQAAADRCILQGDDATGQVRPHDAINRAEMAALLYRATLNQSYGKDCGTGKQPH